MLLKLKQNPQEFERVVKIITESIATNPSKIIKPDLTLVVHYLLS